MFKTSRYARGKTTTRSWRSLKTAVAYARRYANKNMDITRVMTEEGRVLFYITWESGEIVERVAQDFDAWVRESEENAAEAEVAELVLPEKKAAEQMELPFESADETQASVQVLFRGDAGTGDECPCVGRAYFVTCEDAERYARQELTEKKRYAQIFRRGGAQQPWEFVRVLVYGSEKEGIETTNLIERTRVAEAEGYYETRTQMLEKSKLYNQDAYWRESVREADDEVGRAEGALEEAYMDLMDAAGDMMHPDALARIVEYIRDLHVDLEEAKEQAKEARASPPLASRLEA